MPTAPLVKGRWEGLSEDVTARSVLRLAFRGVFPSVRWAKWRLLGVERARLGRLPSRFAVLDAAGKTAHLEGLWMEFGVFRGDSIREIARCTERTVYGFDSFEGLPSGWSPEYPRGRFSLDGEVPKVPPNVALVSGWFDRTLPAFLAAHPVEPVAFAHIDCDLYSSTRTVFEQLGERIRPGTVLVFDEYCTLQPDDESRAFREFLRASHRSFEYLANTVEGFGSVAVEITS